MKRISGAIRRFHEDEEGLEALQVVMIVAIGAVILLAVVKLWPTIRSWFSENTSKVVDDMQPEG